MIGLDVIGPTCSGAILAMPDDADDATVAALALWADTTAFGPLARSIEAVSHREFLDPDRGRFTKAYKGAEWIVTADGGRTLGLLATHSGRAADPFYRDGASLGVEHWGRKLDDEARRGRVRNEWEQRLHEPVIRVKPIGSQGLLAAFGPAGRKGRGPDGTLVGRWERDPATDTNRPSKGHIVDLLGQAHAYDGLDTSELADHLEAFDIPALVEVPLQTGVDPAAAQALLGVALAVHRLTLAVDAEAASWGLGFGEVYSPGGVAQHKWRATRLVPPLERFANLDDAELDRWSAAAHGGWQA